jgi:hypothetical protein
MLNKKIGFTIITKVLFLLVVVVVQGFEWEYSEEEEELYRMPLKQVTPKDGIWTGHIIAYGHYIKPPYKVEVKDTFVYVNNVQIFPVLITEGEKKRREEEKRITSEHKKKRAEVRKKVEGDPELLKLIQKAKEAYRKVIKKGRTKRREAFRAAADVFTSSGSVDSVDVALNYITVYFTGMNLSYLITEVDFDSSLKKTPEEIEQLVKQEEEMIKEFLKDLYKQAEEEGYPPNKYGLSLRAAHGKDQFLRKIVGRGSGVIIETNSSETIGEKTVVFIVIVLRDNSLSLAEKTYILKSKWYMHNYDPSEWPTLKEIREKWKNGREYIKMAKERIKILKVEANEFIEKLKRIRVELNNEN